MARPRDPEIRAALRDRAVDYVLRNGVADLSLRPLAAAIGTNARMLVYHFGSREGLMREILEGLREREDGRIAQWFESGKQPRTLAEFVRWYWRRVSSDEARPAVVLIFELYALALRDRKSYPGVLEEPVAYWRKMLAQAGIAASSASSATATLLLGAMRGLMLDLAATGERSRIDRAMQMLIAAVE